MRKKFLCGVLATAMIFSMTACGNKKSDETTATTTTTVTSEVTSEETATTSDTEDITEDTVIGDITAESLIDNITNQTEDKTVDSEINMNMDISMEMADETGATQNVDMKMNADLHSISNKTVSYTDGSIVVDMAGEQKDINLQSWVSNDENGLFVYTNNSETNEWVKTEDLSGTFNTTTTMGNFSSDMFSDLTLEEEDDGYYITGFIKPEAITNILGNLDSSEMSANITSPIAVEMYFDKETQNLNGISFDMSEALKSAMETTQTTGNFTINNYSLSIIINGYSDEVLEIPSEVLGVDDISTEEIVEDAENTEEIEK